MPRIEIGDVDDGLKKQAQEAAGLADRSVAHMVRRWIGLGSEIDIAAHSYLGRLPTHDEIVDAALAPIISAQKG